MNCSVVVMAGGSGERFWPQSRRQKPKQFLTIVGSESLLRQTVRRARLLAPWSDVYVACGRQHVGLVRAQVPDLPSTNLLVEPVGRDTGPVVALAAALLTVRNPETTMVVLPSDQVITDETRFSQVMEVALATARDTHGLITIGIRPTRPETGYGYIHVGAELRNGAGAASKVLAFTEKPDPEKAAAFLASGEYLWNSGMFVWEVRAIQQAVELHLPEIAETLRPVAAAIGGHDLDKVVAEIFPLLPKVSVDYGVMERASNVWVVPGDFGWDDLGTWAAVDRIAPRDPQGNAVLGQAVLVDTEDTIVSNDSKDRLVVVYGVRGMLVVETTDALLVADKSKMHGLKSVVEEVRRRGFGRFLEESTLPDRQES